MANAYRQLAGVVLLPAVRQLTVILLLGRIAVLPAESLYGFKLMEKGVPKETLSLLVSKDGLQSHGLGVAFYIGAFWDMGWGLRPECGCWPRCSSARVTQMGRRSQLGIC